LELNRHQPIEEVTWGQLLPRCIFCEQVPLKGIAGGYLIKGAFLCEDCEREILGLKAGSVRYEFYREKIKKLLNL